MEIAPVDKHMRVVGKKYLLKEIPRIWTGTRWKCEHNKELYKCKHCQGDGICIHNKHKYSCQECKGNACIHNKYKTTCKDCKGSAICIHDKQKATCKDCKG